MQCLLYNSPSIHNFCNIGVLRFFFFSFQFVFFKHLSFCLSITPHCSNGFYETFLINCFNHFFFLKACRRPQCYLAKSINALNRLFFIWQHILVEDKYLMRLICKTNSLIRILLFLRMRISFLSKLILRMFSYVLV